VNIWVSMCFNCSDSDLIVRSNPVTEDLDPIRICVRRVPIREAIWRPTYEIIQIFVPVRAVQIRRRFRPKITSFHVRDFSCIIYRWQ